MGVSVSAYFAVHAFTGAQFGPGEMAIKWVDLWSARLKRGDNGFPRDVSSSGRYKEETKLELRLNGLGHDGIVRWPNVSDPATFDINRPESFLERGNPCGGPPGSPSSVRIEDFPKLARLSWAHQVRSGP